MLRFITNGNYIELWNLEDSGVPNVNNPNYYKRLFNLHNTSKCIDWSLPSNTNLITFTIDETKFPEIPITSVYFDGVAMNSQDDFETGITAMFPGLAGGSPGGSSYLVYAPILTQTSTDAPLVIGSVNTMGFTTWQRTGTGSYRAASTTPYDANKTWLSGVARSSGNPSVIPLYSFSAISGYISIAYDGNNGVMNVYIDVVDASFSGVELGSLVDIFSFPELRKYE